MLVQADAMKLIKAQAKAYVSELNKRSSKA